MGQHRRFVTLVEQKIGHHVVKLHCIIHQEDLCAKISNSAFNDVMSTVTKIMSLLVASSATTHRQFRSLLEEMESACHDMPLHCSIRRLSRVKVLLRFVECLVEIRAFLIGQGKAYPKLEDEKSLAQLKFLVDIITHLNEFHLRLLGIRQSVMCLFEVWKGFGWYYSMRSTDISHLPRCRVRSTAWLAPTVMQTAWDLGWGQGSRFHPKP